jgi:hypothetical protein
LSHGVLSLIPLIGIKQGKQDGWGAAGISGGVIFAACLGWDVQDKLSQK